MNNPFPIPLGGPIKLRKILPWNEERKQAIKDIIIRANHRMIKSLLTHRALCDLYLEHKGKKCYCCPLVTMIKDNCTPEASIVKLCREDIDFLFSLPLKKKQLIITAILKGGDLDG